MLYENRYDEMYDLAAEQEGYFTSAQAAKAYITAQLIAYHRRAGNIEQVSRGVYRIRSFPRSALAQYVAATMWPVPATAILSPDTALDLHGLSDANPSKIHLTVPKAFRIRRRTVPDLYVLHHADLSASDVSLLEGVPVTTPLRTIRDCTLAHVGPAIVRQAIEEG